MEPSSTSGESSRPDSNQPPSNQYSVRLQTLLPRPPQAVGWPGASSRRISYDVALPRRQPTAVACENCRAKRTKCDGDRPQCDRCRRLELDCTYDAGPDETRVVARKRKYEEMKLELSALQELFLMIRTRPLADAVQIVERIRRNSDPHALLRLLQEGDLLLEAAAMARQSNEGSQEKVLKRINDTALRQSPFRVPALPWTHVAGDGVVSELISIFFAVEQPFIATCVDRKCFIEDIRSANMSGAVHFCSPLLVNALCAYSCFTSNTVKATDALLGGSLQDRFLEEAKMHLDREAGRPSLATVVALHMMYRYSYAAGMDRAGWLYRVYSCEMYKRMRLGWSTIEPAGRVGNGQRNRFQRAVSRLSWGLFCSESMSAFFYVQPSLIPIPIVPRVFYGNKGPLGRPPCNDQFLDAECDVSEILYHVMCYNREALDATGQPQDIEQRLVLYERLLRREPPPLEGPDPGQLGLGQAIFLEAYSSMTAVALFRPLREQHIVLPGNLGTPQTLTLYHCTVIMDLMAAFEAHYPLEWVRGCTSTLYFCYAVGITLIGMLQDVPGAAAPFAKACRHFSAASRNFPICRIVLRGLKAAALELCVTIPEECSRYLAQVDLAEEPVHDVPVSFVLPGLRTGAEDVVGGKDREAESEAYGVELGRVIEKWSRLSTT